ncbi:hypothetical protein LSUB1_G005920, partial [Lachnellula subtilissima]
LDIVNAAIFWVLVHLNARGKISLLLGAFRTSVSLLIVGASSVQIAFYLETGGEIKWGAASNFAHDPAALKLLLSGGSQALLVAVFILVVARVIAAPLYKRTETLVYNLAKTFPILPFKSLKGAEEQIRNKNELETQIYSDSLSEDDIEVLSSDLGDLEATAVPAERNRATNLSLWFRRVLFLTPLVGISILLAVRPRHFPFAHMSGSIPFTLLEAMSPYSQDLCQAGSRDFVAFPLPDLISTSNWEAPNGEFVGWMPKVNASVEEKGHRNLRLPSWLPREQLKGFGRWYHNSIGQLAVSDQVQNDSVEDGASSRTNAEKTYEDINYDPVQDPLRISNLDGDVFLSITEAIKKNKVNIKHVVILSLESTRKDVFPLKKNSHLHDAIMKSHGSAKSAMEASSNIAKLTVNAELLTGEDSGYDVQEEYQSHLNRTWRGLSKEKGGLNVLGAFTGSTSTFKSMLGSHCGVQPLPVDFTVEAGDQIYQPCLPSILQLFNRNKNSSVERGHKETSSDKGFRSQPWRSVFVQSITDQYDRQEELNEGMGFTQVITKETLLDPTSKHYPPTEEESNYFGFPETQVKPYLRDIFQQSQELNERLFLSHFTSSTHHPWNTPGAGKSVDYLKRVWSAEHPLNRYLNTIKYVDGWIGEVMDMIDEFNMAEETLVVMIGDHGYAFEEDSKQHSTFENGHISNMRVPLVFHHPSLPRIQLAINATSLSIIPTILDLLVTTSSLDAKDLHAASSLTHQYEGQSLIRPFVPARHGRQQWNIGVLNAGGGFLSVSSAAVPFRVVLPICKSGVYRFTDTDRDPNELFPIEENSITALAKTLARKYGVDESEWVREAEMVGKWWVGEQRRRWRYDGASLQEDRKPAEMEDMGKTRGKHWWET